MAEYYVQTWAVANEGEVFSGPSANALKVDMDGASVGVMCSSGAGVCVTGPDTSLRNCCFDDGARYWTVGDNWSVAGGKATHASGSTATIEQASALRVGETYDVYLELSGVTAGTVTVSCGTATGDAISSSGFSCRAVACAGTGDLKITPTSTFVGSIDAVYVFQHTGKLVANIWHPISAKGIGTVSSGRAQVGWTYRGR